MSEPISNPFLLTTENGFNRRFSTLEDALSCFDELNWKDQETASLIDTEKNSVWLSDGEGAVLGGRRGV